MEIDGEVADIVLRNVDEIKASMLDRDAVNTLNFAQELNEAITKFVAGER